MVELTMLVLSVVFCLSPKEKANFLAATLLRSYVTPGMVIPIGKPVFSAMGGKT
jgi:uncharacterized membrane protein (DUF485 family)